MPKILHACLLISVSILLIFINCVQAAPAILVNNAPLKSVPSFSGKVLASLSKGEIVSIQKRERGWYQILRENQQLGWVTLLQVRFQPVEQSNSSSNISRVVTLRKGHNTVTATTGVRGIGEADIINAKPDFVALEKVKQYQISEKEAEKFAKKIALKSQEIHYQEQQNEKN